MKVIATEKIPIKLWLEDIEDGALEQTKNLANLPFAFKHVAIMPDAHQGYGMPIGGVLATKGVVIPNAVGVDIGCGMCAVRTSLTEISKDDLKRIMSLIRELIPLGFDHHKEQQHHDYMPMVSLEALVEEDFPVVSEQYTSALYQVGTLGGGNHFIEMQKGSDGFIWIMIHSGSRNLGKTVADHYNKIAVRLNERWFSSVEKSKELAFLPIQSYEAKTYLREMSYCVEFALCNRELMMNRIKACIKSIFPNIVFEPMLNIAHNYANWEHHFGTDVLVHRKGATSARLGEMGIIPGSQGTHSYIVIGLGNTESFMSCSHGAGRKMGRKQAMRELSLEGEIKKLDDLGIIHAIRTQTDLDEAAGAYKDIDIVMKNQNDLVEVVVELTPLAVIKG
jgi:tRNA-splicing ligase RtcB (3'-phosphate/5'-hydroxy nucleic acid ligase)